MTPFVNFYRSLTAGLVWFAALPGSAFICRLCCASARACVEAATLRRAATNRKSSNPRSSLRLTSTSFQLRTTNEAISKERQGSDVWGCHHSVWRVSVKYGQDQEQEQEEELRRRIKK